MIDPGAELRKARELAGLTLRELAQRSGVRLSAISRYETGLVEPAAARWLMLMAHCGAEIAIHFRARK